MKPEDWAIFIFAVLNIIYNIAKAKERPESSVFFGALWAALAAMVYFDVKIF